MASLTVYNGINPIKCTGTNDAKQEIYGNPCFIRFIYWYNPTTAGQLLSIIDENDVDIMVAKCEADGESQFLPVYTYVKSIYCNDMDSGTLYIYI